jgi:glucokinase
MPPAARAVTVSLAGLGDLVCVVGAGALAFDLQAAQPVPEALGA